MDVHVMETEASNADETLYACPVENCGRRLVVNWRRPGLSVLDKGDFYARHVGSSGLKLQVDVTQG